MIKMMIQRIDTKEATIPASVSNNMIPCSESHKMNCIIYPNIPYHGTTRKASRSSDFVDLATSTC